MFEGILCGFSAALCNSIGYLSSAKFLKCCNEPVRLLVYAQIWMMILTAPFVYFVLPEQGIVDLKNFLTALICFIFVFFVGQGSFFTALRFFEASKLSSLLGMKIIVLTLVYTVFYDMVPNGLQIIAILISAVAAVMINWSGKGKFLTAGWLFVAITLVCYSFSDINETAMILCLKNSSLGTFRSALGAAAVGYTALGVCSLPGLFFVKFEKKLFLLSFPYAFLWLFSQVMLFCCYALILPIFGNMILASRGVFSVILGGVLARCGVRDLDASISGKQWLLRGVAALLMIVAIALYSYAVMK